jgi:hypothetical protein
MTNSVRTKEPPKTVPQVNVGKKFRSVWATLVVDAVPVVAESEAPIAYAEGAEAQFNVLDVESQTKGTVITKLVLAVEPKAMDEVLTT